MYSDVKYMDYVVNQNDKAMLSQTDKCIDFLRCSTIYYAHIPSERAPCYHITTVMSGGYRDYIELVP